MVNFANNYFFNKDFIFEDLLSQNFFIILIEIL